LPKIDIVDLGSGRVVGKRGVSLPVPLVGNGSW
jgi:hypothetical protein